MKDVACRAACIRRAITDLNFCGALKPCRTPSPTSTAWRSCRIACKRELPKRGVRFSFDFQELYKEMLTAPYIKKRIRASKKNQGLDDDDKARGLYQEHVAKHNLVVLTWQDYLFQFLDVSRKVKGVTEEQAVGHDSFCADISKGLISSGQHGQ